MLQGINWGRVMRVAVLLAVLGLVIFIGFRVRQVLPPFLFAIIITYVLSPVVDFGERKGLSRGQALAGTYVALAVLVVLLAVYVVPVLLVEINRLIANLPMFVDALQRAILDFEGYYARTALPPAVREAINQSIETNLGKIEEHTATLLGGLVTGVMGVFSSLFNLILGPILAAYMLKDFRKFHRNIENAFAPARRKYINAFMADVDRVLSGFLHGRLIVSLVVGVLAAVALQLLGVRFALILGLIAGLTNLIPYFGPFIGAVPALLLAGLDNWALFFKVGILYLAIQQLDGFVISPRILGTRTGLHPLGVIFAVLAGGVLFGFWGLFLGVPTAAVLKVCVDHIIAWSAS